MSSPQEKFYQATIALVGPGPIKERLASAYLRNLAELSENDLPEDIRSDFCELSRVLHKVPPVNGEGSVAASIRKMSWKEADEFATRIVLMYDVVARHKPAAQPNAA